MPYKAKYPVFRGFYTTRELSQAFDELSKQLKKSKGDMFREAVNEYVVRHKDHEAR